jgi:DNA-binding transcriptional ArsR family regulator
MSRRRDISAVPGQLLARAPLFSALGDGTRLRLIGNLSGGEPRSISELAEGSELTRQAITKHLRILEGVGLVHGERRGREILFEFKPKPISEAIKYLDHVSRQWDEALGRLKKLVESDPGDGP